jgi:hypothetical protein
LNKFGGQHPAPAQQQLQPIRQPNIARIWIRSTLIIIKITTDQNLEKYKRRIFIKKFENLPMKFSFFNKVWLVLKVYKLSCWLSALNWCRLLRTGEGFIHLHRSVISARSPLWYFRVWGLQNIKISNLSFTNEPVLFPFARLAFINEFVQVWIGQIIDIHSSQSKLVSCWS